MARDNYIDSALLEHRFWLQILGDHARFISHLLSANESQEIYRASQYINEFDEILDESRRNLSREELNLLNPRNKSIHSRKSTSRNAKPALS